MAALEWRPGQGPAVRSFFRSPGAALRLGLAAAAAVILTAVAWQGVCTAVSDHALDRAQGADRDNPEMVARDLHRALRYRPDLAEGWRLEAARLALIDPSQARFAAEHAARLAPNEWENWSSLSLIEFQLGHAAASKQDLARAEQLNQGFEGHYQLGNLELAEGDGTAYWREMARALQFASPEQADLVLNRAAALASSQPRLILGILPASRPEVTAEAIRFLAGRDLDTAVTAWSHQHCASYQRAICGATAVLLANRISQDVFAQPLANDSSTLITSAIRIWDQAISQGELAQDPARAGHLADPGFLRDWQGPAFSWFGTQFVPLVVDAPHAPMPGTHALRLEFNGEQADAGDILRQFVPVSAGNCYRFSLASRRMGNSAEGGMTLAVASSPEQELARMPLRLGPQWQTNPVEFCVPKKVNLIAISLGYERPSGQVRLHDFVLVADPQLQSLPSLGSHIAPQMNSWKPSLPVMERSPQHG